MAIFENTILLSLCVKFFDGWILEALDMPMLMQGVLCTREVRMQNEVTNIVCTVER